MNLSNVDGGLGPGPSGDFPVTRQSLARATPTGDGPSGSQIAYDVLSAGVQAQGTHADALDTKLGLLAGTGTGLVALLVAVLALKPVAVGTAPGGLAAALATYLLVLVTAGSGILPRKWGLWIKNSKGLLEAVDGGFSGSSVQKGAVVALAKLYQRNAPRLRYKGRALQFAYLALAGEAVSFLAVLVPVAWRVFGS